LITQYTNGCTDGNALFADSIGAMVFSKQTSGNQVRFTQINSDPAFRDMFVLNDDAIYQLANLQKGRELTEFMIRSFGDQFRRGCMSLKTIPKDLDYIAMSCSTYQATKTVLEAMNFPLERTGIECLTRVPHMGTNDLIFQIEHGIEQGMIKQGSKILVTGTSLGFSIATMAIEWGVD
jgi:3-oxoacyl-[acyl-carrier-protein] synthase III